jgi:hypothetical protein
VIIETGLMVTAPPAVAVFTPVSFKDWILVRDLAVQVKATDKNCKAPPATWAGDQIKVRTSLTFLASDTLVEEIIQA